jgi:Protein of unknown function (DUF1573)
MGNLVKCATLSISLFFCLFGPITSAAGSQIALDKKEYDFGDVRVGRVVQVRASLSNKGKAPLIIKEVRTSCGCTKAESAQKQIPPGERGEIAISYDSAGLSSGRKTQTVFIHSNDMQNPVSKIRIFANVIHPISIDPSSLIARLPRFQDHISFPVTARNNSQQSVTLSVSRFGGAIRGGSLQPETVTIEPGSEVCFKIEMALNKPEKGNAVIGELFIGTDLPDFSQIKLSCLIKLDRAE